MTTITIDAARKDAKARLGVRGSDFVVTFLDFDAELVFTDSGGSLWSAISLAGGIGVAIAERARAHGEELMEAAAAVADNGRVN